MIYRLNPQARARITAVYMTTAFIGGAAGSALASFSFRRGGVEWSLPDGRAAAGYPAADVGVAARPLKLVRRFRATAVAG